MALKSLARNQSGQATIEYILLLSVIVSFFVTISAWVTKFGLAQKMAKPITKDFASTYQIGAPDGAGFDSDSPKDHPRIQDCDNCFRIYLNPKAGGG